MLSKKYFLLLLLIISQAALAMDAVDGKEGKNEDPEAANLSIKLTVAKDRVRRMEAVYGPVPRKDLKEFEQESRSEMWKDGF